MTRPEGLATESRPEASGAHYTAGGAGPDSDAELSFREIRRVISDNWRMIAWLAFVAPAFAAVIVLLTPRTYTSTASFFPETRRGGGGLSSIAQQYGIALPGMGADAGQSLAFYVELVRSREILAQLLEDSVTVAAEAGARRRPLPDFLEIEATDPAERLEEGVFALRRMIRPLSNPNTGIVRIDVTSKSPVVSQALAARMLDLINEFNLRKRQSQGASERRFAERRLQEMTDSLQAAERRLQEFEQRNMQFATAPHLRMQQRRLMNDLASKQTLHTAMAQAYEQARVEEVRDTPVITALERPTVPVRPDSRGGVQKMMFAFILALGVGIALAFARSSFGFWKPAR